MSDLCWVCQCNNMNIVRAANIPEEEKSEVLKKNEDHLRTATMQLSHYIYMCEQSRAIAKEYNLLDFRKSEHYCFAHINVNEWLHFWLIFKYWFENANTAYRLYIF